MGFVGGYVIGALVVAMGIVVCREGSEAKSDAGEVAGIFTFMIGVLMILMTIWYQVPATPHIARVTAVVQVEHDDTGLQTADGTVVPCAGYIDCEEAKPGFQVYYTTKIFDVPSFMSIVSK